MIASADVANGAMIALVPSAPDLERLAVEGGGEPLEQLHLTLLYLGEADKIDEATRQALIDAGRDTAVGWDGVAAEAFAPALFNPNGDEPCAVMLCSGAELAEFYETIMADVTELIDLPDDMHVPFCAHITLMYFANVVDGHFISEDGAASTDLASLIDRTGPVTFDRLRFAFGGEVTDIPLVQTPGPLQSDPDVTVDVVPDSPMPDPSTVASADPHPLFTAMDKAMKREAFDGCLRCYGPAHIGDCPPGL